MKVIKFANLLAFAIAISLGVVGCKTQTPRTITFDDKNKSGSGSGTEQTAGNAGKLDTDSGGISKSADTTGIAMGNGHPAAHQQQGDEQQADKKKEEEEQRATLERFYYAQCVKDETMAESITNALAARPNAQEGGQDAAQIRPLVVHFNGAFHSDYRLGTASRAVRRSPKSNVKVISVVPVEDLDAIKADEYRKRADYVIFTLKPPVAQ